MTRPIRARFGRSLVVVALASGLALTAGGAAAQTSGAGTAPGAKPAARAPAKRPAAKPATAPRETRAPQQIAADARAFEDVGAYTRALEHWRALRPLVPPDGDLELMTALAEARCGMLDSAAARLASPVLDAAAMDTVPAGRYRNYGPEHDKAYVGGAFEGWHWYVWRARAEVALAQGRWQDGVQAARRAAAARPMSGKDWLLLAVCAGRAGLDDEARAAAAQAARLDPSLPEAAYLDGLWAWRSGRRSEAQASFRAAAAADPTFMAAALALVRSRLPGTAPDTLPAHFLTADREAGILTSPVGPKVEHFIQVETPAIIARKTDPVVPDSLKQALFRKRLPVWVLVDERGRVVLTDVAWYEPGTFPTAAVTDLVAHLMQWEFTPAKVRGEFRRVWVDMLYQFAL